VRADLLRRLDRPDEARAAYDEAIALGTNEVEQRYLQKRRAAIAATGSSPAE
jgi:predicted RNA polymerase sigma factor